MKRLHVHVGVEDLDHSIRFYATLFGAEPSVRHADYAKWMLDDPRVNFAISTRGGKLGLDHLGIQAETTDELHDIAGRLKAADKSVFEQTDAACCYARSDKAWVADPAGLMWETFHTSGAITTYGEDTAKKATPADAAAPATGPTAASSCCAPSAKPIATAAVASPNTAAKSCC